MTVGIDIGTTSVKAVVATGDGAIVSRIRLPHRLIVPSAKRMEHDAADAWWDGPRRAWAALASPDVGALAVSAMVPSLAPVGSGGKPVGPGLLYGDERGAEGNGYERGDPSTTHETVGFLRWLAGAYPEAAGYWPAQAVANRALGGEGALDYGSAYSSGALFDGSGWDASYCGSCGVTPAQLPSVRMFGEVVGEVKEGAGRGALIGTGSVDAYCEQLVAGVETPGDVLVVCGSTLVVWAVAEGWPEADGLWTMPYHLPGRVMVGGASNAGGLFLDWVDRAIAPDERALSGHPDGDPWAVPVWWPYIRGERAPLFDPGLRAAVAGIDLTQGPGQLRRAAYEASAFAARSLIDRATEATGRKPQRVVATGGGTRVKGWMQALADVTGVPVHPMVVPEGAALGAAYLARMAAGLESRIEEAARWGATGTPFEPDPAWVGPAGERYLRYLEGSPP